MSILIENISSLVMVESNKKEYKAGSSMQEIFEIKDGAMIFDTQIEWIGSTEDLYKNNIKQKFSLDKIISGKGKTILPGFVDSHTHLVFAGNRSDEFARRLRGTSYQEIAAEGGGILRTMSATRKASVEELADNARKLLVSAINHGTTAIEIKSGYGLTLESEIKQLEAIQILKKEFPLHIASTFLGAHDIPPEYKNNKEKYIDIICNEMIPMVAEHGLAEFCDAFVDEGYFSIEDGERIFQTGLKYGLIPKVHSDELASFHSAQLAARVKAISADHLLLVDDEGIIDLVNANTVATLLPGTAYFLKVQYAPARKFIEKNAIVALATDCNPGSCFTENMQVILSLAVTNMKMTCEEAISGATLNGSAAIGQSKNMGSLEVGKKSNFIISNITSYSDLFYHFGINHIDEVWINGAKYVCI